ncbi:MAG: ParA family protein [Oceanicaulis sp.]
MTCTTVMFANAKGGAGKSTIAFLSALHFAATHNVRVCVVDFDRLRTTYNAVRRFAGSGVQSFYLADEYGEGHKVSPDAVRSALDGCRAASDTLFVDTPAGFPAGTMIPAIAPDVIFVPVSVSDADIMATKAYLPELESAAARLTELTGVRPRIVIVPNQVFSEDDAKRMRDIFRGRSIRIAPALAFSRALRDVFHFEPGDTNIASVFRDDGGFFQWMSSEIFALHQQTR